MMRLELMTLCSAMLLLLCMAVCVLWVRSDWVVDALQRYRPGAVRVIREAVERPAGRRMLVRYPATRRLR
jgi:hypothetical protein